ncbi:hypothetical protein JW979_01745, partial [bacterium]|nr:hypothetical protein [candidate division CSSED10-310 bacterium]
MNFEKYSKFVVLFLLLLISNFASATVWPVPDTGRKGVMTVYGDYRFGDLGCNVHAAIDITQNIENDKSDSCKIPVQCIQNSEFVCYIVNKETGTLRPGNIDGIVLLCGYNYHVYQHVKGIDPQQLESRPNFPNIAEGQHIGYIAESGDDAYGNSSPHLHFAIYGGNILKGTDTTTRRLRISFFRRMNIEALWGFNYDPGGVYPIENPLNILPDADVQDTIPPVFLNSDVSGTPIDVVPNLAFQNSRVFTTGYVDKEKCPWVVRGKVDIIARVNDYMNVRGQFSNGSYTTDVIPGIYEIKYEIYLGASQILERKLIWSDLPNSNYHGLLPGGILCRERFEKSLPVHPHSTDSFYCPGYDSYEYNYNYYVV